MAENVDFSKGFGQFGEAHKDNDPKPHGEVKQEEKVEGFDFGAKLSRDMLQPKNGFEDDKETTRLIKPGVYDFTVYAAKQGVADKGKFRGFNRVNVVLKINPHDGIDKPVKVFDNFPLVNTMMWKASRFVACIGMFDEAEKYGMEWDQYVGEGGQCEIETNEYNGDKKNRVKKYILRGKKAVE